MSDFEVDAVIDGTCKRVALMCYSFSLSFVMEDETTHELGERSHRFVCTAASLTDLFAQVRSASHRLLTNYLAVEHPVSGRRPYLGCVKVSRSMIGPLDEYGCPAPNTLFDLFEWKCDHPSGFEEAVASTIVRSAAIREKISKSRLSLSEDA